MRAATATQHCAPRAVLRRGKRSHVCLLPYSVSGVSDIFSTDNVIKVFYIYTFYLEECTTTFYRVKPTTKLSFVFSKVQCFIPPVTGPCYIYEMCAMPMFVALRLSRIALQVPEVSGVTIS